MEWYSTLNKPSLNPPSWIFAPVWTTLYILIAFSFYTYLKHKPTKFGIGIFIIHMISNFAWSPLFFNLRNPVASLVDVVIMCVTLAFVLYEWKKSSLTAVYLLLPYFAWILFASYLNYEIVVLN